MADDKQHSPSPVPGAEKFSKWLHGRPGVGKFHESNFRTSRVSSRGREPKLRRSKHHVQVDFYAGGFVKVYRIWPSTGLSVDDLEKLLNREFATRNHRGGNGMSPKEPIAIPDAIRRRQEFEASRLCPAPLTPTPEARPMETPGSRTVPTLPPINLTPHQAVAYRFLLGLDPSGKAATFTIEGVATRLAEKYNSLAIGGGLFTALKKKELVVPGKQQGTSRNAKKLFTIIRREIVEKVSTKRSTTAPKTAMPKSSVEMQDLDDLRFFFNNREVLAEAAKYRAVLVEAELRSKAMAERGLEIKMIDGRPGLFEINKKPR